MIQSMFEIEYTPNFIPLRVDFSGGWLDSIGANRQGGYIVNCAISPCVSINNWPYSQKSGLGGSNAWAILNGINPIEFDFKHSDDGWQDSAIILETGCCVWKSGSTPILDFKRTGNFLAGKMALYDTHTTHDNIEISKLARNYEKIIQASKIARKAVLTENIFTLAQAINLTYREQLCEGMKSLPSAATIGALSCKYCGGGHGGYALYLFESSKKRQLALKSHKNFYPIEPYYKAFHYTK